MDEIEERTNEPTLAMVAQDAWEKRSEQHDIGLWRVQPWADLDEKEKEAWDVVAKAVLTWYENN